MQCYLCMCVCKCMYRIIWFLEIYTYVYAPCIVSVLHGGKPKNKFQLNHNREWDRCSAKQTERERERVKNREHETVYCTFRFGLPMYSKGKCAFLYYFGFVTDIFFVHTFYCLHCVITAICIYALDFSSFQTIYRHSKLRLSFDKTIPSCRPD